MAEAHSKTIVIFAVFSVFCSTLASSTPPPGFLSKNYAQIAQHFGFPSPKLPNISFANVGKQCKETVEKLNTSKLAYPYLDAIGKPQSGLFLGNLGWLGSYSECTKSIVNAHYCLAYVAVPALNITQKTPIRWGICAPKQCSEEDVTNALQDIFTGLNKEYNQTLARLIPEPVAFASKDSQSKPVFCNKKSEYTAGVIMTLILCGLILFLCLVGTIIDIVVNFRKSHLSPVNKSDGFMPIRNISIVADHNQAPHVQNSLAKSDPDSDKTNLLQSSHDVNFSASITLSNFHQEPARPNMVVQFFLCFSLIQNTRLIMDTKVPSTAITSINGMRVLSMWWVILGHTYSVQTMWTIPVSNGLLAYNIIHRFTFQTVDNATFSVDSFFFLSGLLVAYLSLRRMEKKNGELPLFKYYFHRFWRLTPTYMFVLLFYHKMTGFLGEGPFWYGVQTETQCSKYWWTNLLYINNFYPTSFGASCMGWAWYLANDMQFYIIAPAILFTAYRFRLPGLLAITGVLAVSSFITTAVLYAHYDLDAVLGEQPAGVDFDSLIYVKPYCRIAPYLVGMVLGYLLIHSKDWRLPTKVHTYLFNVAGWCVAIILALSTLYGEYKVLRKDNPQPFSRAENITYGTFSRCAWSLALAWVIFACHRGLGGLVNRILSARFWIPLSRLTYCAYLVHIIAMVVLFISYENLQAYSDVHTAFCFVGIVAISYAAAFIVSVCVEFPMMQLEKLIFKSDR